MILVTSYLNPDLDGVACGIAFAGYIAQREAVAAFAGRYTTETTEVLKFLRLDAPPEVATRQREWDEVVLVDCHHPAQLPHVSDLGLVTDIVDHHPDGDAAAFPNATVQNEVVGAAATLIAERIARDNGGLEVLPPPHAALLACAIASNTLDFSAASSTNRDRRQFDALRGRAGLEFVVDDVVVAMRAWRSVFLTLETEEAVQRDVKVIDCAFGRVAVSQLEGDGARLLLTRSDLRSAVDALGELFDVTATLLSLVDTASGTTSLVTGDPRVADRLLTSLGPTVLDDGTMELPFVALRKTHVVPALTD